MRSKTRAHHLAAWVSILTGLDFLVETSALRSAAISGPVGLADVLGLPFNPLHIWGLAFLSGGVLILLSWTPLLRAIFLVLGVGSWAVFAASSFYESWAGSDANNTNAFPGILMLLVLATFSVAIHNVMVDFTSRSNSGKVEL